jgi:hypothetical protein
MNNCLYIAVCWVDIAARVEKAAAIAAVLTNHLPVAKRLRLFRR